MLTIAGFLIFGKRVRKYYSLTTEGRSIAKERVSEFIENPVPRPRTVGQFLTPEFLAIKARLDELIHAPSGDDEDDKLPMIKMTATDDEVE